MQPLRVGIGGPVGSGKTALTLALCRAMRTGFRDTRDMQRRLAATRARTLGAVINHF